jgi:alanyl-tRNA synthetase
MRRPPRSRRPVAEVEARIAQLLESARATEKELSRLKAKAAASAGDDLAGSAIDVKGAKVLAVSLDGADVKALRETMDKLKDKLKSAAIVLGSVTDGKVTLIAGVTSDLTRRSRRASSSTTSHCRSAAKAAAVPTWRRRGARIPPGLPTRSSRSAGSSKSGCERP